MPDPLPRRVIAIGDPQWLALLRLAELNGTSASALVREAVSRFLADLGVTPTYTLESTE